MLILATTNFKDAIDPALASRADWIFEVPLPDLAARRTILEHTVAAVAAAFPEAQGLLECDVLDQGAEPQGNSPAASASFIKEEEARWRDVIKSANVTLE